MLRAELPVRPPPLVAGMDRGAARPASFGWRRSGRTTASVLLPSLPLLHLFSCGPKSCNSDDSWRGSELCLSGGESLSWLHEGE
ncbi:hypothetical protein DAI22_01g465400 [Oryza sativa Japonica Group]|nr:hypothetical protein DAI22_01g465400 [Oryza sativa Japonica Group]